MGYAGGMRQGNVAHKTLYNRWNRWSEKGIFARMLLDNLRPAKHLPADHGYDADRYRQRHRIENCFTRLKEWRPDTTDVPKRSSQPAPLPQSSCSGYEA